MEFITQLFGKEENLTSLQMAARAVLVFVAALIIIRIGSTRTFGKESVIDNIVVIMLGGILSRVITGAAPFLPVMAATFTIIIVHRMLAYLCMYNHTIGNIIKGKKKILYEDGTYIAANMRSTLISKEDIAQGAREAAQVEDPDAIKKVVVERNGRLTVVKSLKAAGN